MPHDRPTIRLSIPRLDKLYTLTDEGFREAIVVDDSHEALPGCFPETYGDEFEVSLLEVRSGVVCVRVYAWLCRVRGSTCSYPLTPCLIHIVCYRRASSARSGTSRPRRRRAASSSDL